MKNVFCTLLIFAVVLSSCTKSDNTKNTRTINGSGHLKSLPDSGLIALYEFTGNADDGSGNGNNGTIHGGVTLCNDRFGNPNMAYHFNGIDSYITTVTGVLSEQAHEQFASG